MKNLILLILFLLLTSSSIANEGRVLRNANGLYTFKNIFKNTALIRPSRFTDGGLLVEDMHATVIKVINFGDCTQIIVDIPAWKPLFSDCVENGLKPIKLENTEQ